MSALGKVFRGQVWYIEEDPYITKQKMLTSVQAKSRPWLIISCEENNIHSTTFNAVPISTGENDYFPAHVFFWNTQRHPNAPQLILCEQPMTFDIQMLARRGNNYMYTLSSKIMAEVSVKLANQLQISLMDLIGNPKALTNALEMLMASLNKKSSDTETNIDAALNALKTALLSSASFPAKNSIPEKTETTVTSQKKTTSQSNFASSIPNQTPHKFVRRKNVWALEAKKEFLKDCSELTPDEVVRKWNLNSKSTMYTYRSKFKTEFGE